MAKKSSEKENTNMSPAVTTTVNEANVSIPVNEAVAPPRVNEAVTTTVNEAVAPPRVVIFTTLKDTVVNTRFTEQIPAMLITTFTRQNGGMTLQFVDANGTVFKVVVQAQKTKQGQNVFSKYEIGDVLNLSNFIVQEFGGRRFLQYHPFSKVTPSDRSIDVLQDLQYTTYEDFLSMNDKDENIHIRGTIEYIMEPEYISVTFNDKPTEKKKQEVGVSDKNGNFWSIVLWEDLHMQNPYLHVGNPVIIVNGVKTQQQGGSVLLSSKTIFFLTKTDGIEERKENEEKEDRPSPSKKSKTN
jgi:hypothetical protein